MALDATVGGTSADSYLTVADADALAADDLGPEAELWRAATTTVEQRERALKRAARDIDGWVRTGYPRHSATQALRFPRSVDEASGLPLIPRDVRLAAYHQAAYVLSNASTIDRASTRHARNQSQASETSYQYAQPRTDLGESVMSPRALHFLSAFQRAGRSTAGTLQSSRIASGFPGVSW